MEESSSSVVAPRDADAATTTPASQASSSGKATRFRGTKRTLRFELPLQKDLFFSEEDGFLMSRIKDASKAELTAIAGARGAFRRSLFCC